MFSNVTFRPSENGCELTASGGEIGLRSSIAAETTGEGILSVPVSLLARWLKEGRDESVSFHETDQNWIQVRCGGNDTRIPGRVGEPSFTLGAAGGTALFRAPGNLCDAATSWFLCLPGSGGCLGRDCRSADRSRRGECADCVLGPLAPGLLERHFG